MVLTHDNTSVSNTPYMELVCVLKPSVTFYLVFLNKMSKFTVHFFHRLMCYITWGVDNKQNILLPCLCRMYTETNFNCILFTQEIQPPGACSRKTNSSLILSPPRFKSKWIIWLICIPEQMISISFLARS